MNERAYIPFPERLAATLACLLPQEQRDQMRRARVEAQAVISLFHFDHIELHAIGGSDLWWNLDPKEVAPHREKSRGDTSIVAKSKRIRRKQAEHQAVMAGEPIIRPRRKAKIAARPFSKQHRPLRSGNKFRSRQ